MGLENLFHPDVILRTLAAIALFTYVWKELFRICFGRDLNTDPNDFVWVKTVLKRLDAAESKVFELEKSLELLADDVDFEKNVIRRHVGLSGRSNG